MLFSKKPETVHYMLYTAITVWMFLKLSLVPAVFTQVLMYFSWLAVFGSGGGDDIKKDESPKFDEQTFLKSLGSASLTSVRCPMLYSTNRTKKTKPIVIVVDGEIAAGKSTLLTETVKLLKQDKPSLEVVQIPEPVDVWKETGILASFYRDPKRFAYTFQTFVYVTRIEQVQRYFEQNPNADVYLLERSIFTDAYMFVLTLLKDNVMTQEEGILYVRWWHRWGALMPFRPDAFFYHKPTLDECMRRFVERARLGENFDKLDTDGTAKYQQKLRLAHEEFFSHGTVMIGQDDTGQAIRVPVVVHQDDRDIRTDAAYRSFVSKQFSDLIEQIKQTQESVGTRQARPSALIRYKPCCSDSDNKTDQCTCQYAMPVNG